MGRDTAKRNYDSVAWFYERSTHRYSRGRIRAAKAWQVEHLEPGDRVLYAGVGAGEDAIMAARCGARVTGVDIAPKMLQRAQRRFASEGLAGTFVRCDVTDVAEADSYDAVAANFFLNIFEEPVMVRVLDHLAMLLRPGGLLLIADFMPPRRRGIPRFLQQAYRASGNTFYWALGLAPLGSIHDYPAYFSDAGLELEDVQTFPLTDRGPDAFWSIAARRI